MRVSVVMVNIAPMFQPQPQSLAFTVAIGTTGVPVNTALLSLASRYCALMPAPSDSHWFTFQPIDGLMLTVFTSDVSAWNCPTQGASQSVLRPNGALTPIPSQSVFAMTSQERYAFGTKPQLPASPSFPRSEMVGAGPGVVLAPLLENLTEVLIASMAPTTCRPPTRVIPAGLNQIVLAS